MSLDPKLQEGSRERSPLLEMVVLAAPTVATMTSYTLMQFIDKLMVSRIGPDPIYVGAQGNGGLASWVPVAGVMGLITVINTYVSQNLGAGRPDKAPAYAWAGIWLSCAFCTLFMIPFGLVLPSIFELGRSTATLDAAAMAEAIRRDELATGYARILIFGSVLTMASRSIAQYFYGMHKPVVVLAASLCGNLSNLILNSLLIYGPVAPASTGIGVLDAWFGFTAGLCGDLGIPRLALTGAAIATVVGTAIELIIPMAVFLSPRFHRLYGTRRQWRPSWGPMRDLLRLGWPGALMFGNEMICWAFFMVYLVGEFGHVHSTAGWIAHQWMSLSFMPAVGLSVAITASVGKCMGASRPDLAARRAWLGLSMAVVYMSLCGVVFVVFRHDLTRLFIQKETPAEDAARIIALGGGFLIATAAFQFFDAIAMSLSGALRGAGDTRWPGVVTVLLSWSLIVGGGLAMVRLAPQLESLGPWIAASGYIVVLSLAILFRFVGGRWKRIQLVSTPPCTAH